MNKYFLHIDKPCTEDWDKMTPASQGRFCGSCQKTVFDFTNATDNDIIRHIEKMKGNMFCGLFEEGQLNRWMEKTGIETSNPSLYKYLLSFLLLTAAGNAAAQEVKAKQENVVKINKEDSVLMAQALRAEIPNRNCNDTLLINSKKVRLRGEIGLISNSKNPLYLVDGTLIDSLAFSKVNLSKVVLISTLQSAQAQALFGPDGANGAIIISTKAEKKKKLIKKILKNK
jgi:hypothetical protein